MTHHDPDHIACHMEGSVTEIADILAEFAQELRNGDVHVWKGQRELHLNPEGRLSLRVQARADDQREGLEMQLSWTVSSGGDALRP